MATENTVLKAGEPGSPGYPILKMDDSRALFRRITGIVLAVLCIVAGFMLPLPDGLTRAGMESIMILVSLIIMFVARTFPVGIIALLYVIVCPVVGVCTPAQAYAGFGSVMFFFVITVSAMTVVILKTTLPVRLVSWLVSIAKANPKRVVLGFMFSTWLFSSIMSNIPTALLFIGIAMPVLEAMKAEPGKSNFGRCLMMGIPTAGMVGGISTPVGTSINIMAMQFLQQATGITIGFVQWMCIGIPIAAIVFVALFLTITTLYPPEEIPEFALKSIHDQRASFGKLSVYEWKVIFTIGVMLILWIVGSYVTQINMLYVSTFGLVFMMLPFNNMMTWDEFEAGCPWQIVMVYGAVSVVAVPFLATGAAQWIADTFAALTAGASPMMFVLLLALFITCLNAVFPMGPAVVGLLCTPIVMIAATTQLCNPALAAMIVAMPSEATFMLPLSMMYLLTLEKGYYTIGQVAKSGIIPSLVLILALAFIAQPLCNIFW